MPRSRSPGGGRSSCGGILGWREGARRARTLILVARPFASGGHRITATSPAAAWPPGVIPSVARDLLTRASEPAEQIPRLLRPSVITARLETAPVRPCAPPPCHTPRPSCHPAYAMAPSAFAPVTFQLRNDAELPQPGGPRHRPRPAPPAGARRGSLPHPAPRRAR